MCQDAYNTETIRELLSEAFDDETLTTLCADHFTTVEQQFTVGMTKGQKIHLLIGYCTRYGQTEQLLERARKKNPYQYKRFAPRLYDSQCILVGWQLRLPTWARAVIIVSSLALIVYLFSIILQKGPFITPPGSNPVLTSTPPSVTIIPSRTPMPFGTPTNTTTPSPTPTHTMTPFPTSTRTPTPIPVTPIPLDKIKRGCEQGKFEGPNGSLSQPTACGATANGVSLSWNVKSADSYAGCIIDLVLATPIAPNITHLILRVSGKQGGELFEIGLESGDHEWKESVESVSIYEKQIAIPLANYSNQKVELAKLNKLIIAFNHNLGESALEGRICITEIGFGSP